MVSELNSTSSAPATQNRESMSHSRSSVHDSKVMAPMKLELAVKLNQNNFLLWRQQIMAAIKAVMLTHEARLEQHTHTETLNVNMAVNKKDGSGNHSSTGRGSSQTFNNQTSVGGSRSGNQNQGRRGRGRNKFNNNGQFQCQICYRMGHIASRCYYRFDQTFQLQNSGQQHGGGATANSSHSGPMTAMVATPDSVADPLWYTDSGAIDHCTPEGHNLQHKMDYQGKKKVFMGNGAGLHISSTGRILITRQA
ncbi:hypothetical protein ACOSQ4_012392 [Xanthoceras sorbifolium]